MATKSSWLGRLFSWAQAPKAAAQGHIWSRGQVILEDFVVERELGHGGMGTVYLLRSQSSGERFAVKTIRPAMLGNAASQRLFLDELQTWIDLPEHPHLTSCRFFRTVDAEVAIFAEFVEGGSLADWIHPAGVGQDYVLLPDPGLASLSRSGPAEHARAFPGQREHPCRHLLGWPADRPAYQRPRPAEQYRFRPPGRRPRVPPEPTATTTRSASMPCSSSCSCSSSAASA